MKTLRNIFCLTLISLMLIGCNSGDDEITDDPVICEFFNELRLSIDNPINSVYSVDTVFAILSGNGGYRATSESDRIKLEVKDTLVYVSFLANGSYLIKVEDAKGRSKEVSLDVNHRSLVSTRYTMTIVKDSTHLLGLGFGAGGYTLENIKGTSAEVSIVNDKVKAWGLDYGSTYLDIVDKRGTEATAKIQVIAIYSLESSTMNIKMYDDQITSIRLKYGSGGWKIESYPDELFRASLLEAGDYSEYDVLQIDSFAGKTGTGSVQLKDKDNNRVVVSVVVE